MMFNFGLTRASGIVLGPKRVDQFGTGWRRTVYLLDGRRFRVGVDRGKRCRIAYKPRGKNIGFWWYGWVMDEAGSYVLGTRVPKTVGVRGLLIDAGILGRRDKHEHD